MKVTGLFISFIFLIYQNAIGQKNLTREEILYHWTLLSTEKPKDKDSIVITEFDQIINSRIHKLIDSLQNINIDSIIVYSVAYPGYIRISTCSAGLIPTDTYLIWKLKGKTYIKNLEGNCYFHIITIKSSILFNFYDMNYLKITNETFMPVIYSGQISDSNKVSFSISMVDHEPNYSLYYSIGKDNKIVHFTESDLENKKSLFHEHNLKLKIFHWWEIIKRQVDNKN